jgi:alkylation response protein AidB-like acyl-CoA dehydrogenase
MPTYKAPLRDIKFALMELAGLDNIRTLPGGSEITNDLVEAILTEAAKLCENILFPINQGGDKEGCKLDKGEVKTPSGFKEAYNAFVEGGWLSLSCAPEYEGQGLPHVINLCAEEMVCSSNLAFSLYPGLTRGAYALLSKHGSDVLKKKFLPKMVQGKWSGTMCLTEAHCGTDLGILRTKAIPQSDGTYKISGTKIFISSGEHDLTENILHFVIARPQGAPIGIKGIGLFLVPKFLVDDEGKIGARNGVLCSGIEHKMGIKGSSTCVINFEDATGYLIGDLSEGVSNMFTMMNLERLGVGTQGLGIGEVSYQNALAYAKERLQGRSLSGAKFPDKVADPIIVHPDVRRMLLTMKTLTEGNRMLAAWVTMHLDIAERTQDEEQRQFSDDFVYLMTPIVKAFLTESGFEIANLAVQVFGGHGYIFDNGVEQYARDARIAQIYEGTNGIQSLDLVGRKMPAHMGRYLRRFFHPMQDYIETHKANENLKEFIDPLAKALGRLQQASITLATRALANPEEAGAASVDFLHLFAYTAHAYLWARAVEISLKCLEEGKETIFYQSKIDTGRFFVNKLLPRTSSLFASIMAGASSLMNVKEESFGPF